MLLLLTDRALSHRGVIPLCHPKHKWAIRFDRPPLAPSAPTEDMVKSLLTAEADRSELAKHVRLDHSEHHRVIYAITP